MGDDFRRIRGLLDSFRALVLPRTSRPPTAPAAPARAGGHTVTNGGPAVCALERRLAVRASCIRSLGDHAGSDGPTVALSRYGVGAGARTYLGGPAIVGIVHRVAAVVMTGGFIIHFGYVALYLAHNWRTVSWFGPHSVLPTLQDGRDLMAMLKWFVAAGPRPTFDHWNYQQKLDYWGSFSGSWRCSPRPARCCGSRR